MLCGDCNADNDLDSASCQHCGSALAGACLGCGRAVAVLYSFCGQCQTKRFSREARSTPPALTEELPTIDDSSEAARFQLATDFFGQREVLENISSSIVRGWKSQRIAVIRLVGEAGAGQSRIGEELIIHLTQDAPVHRAYRTRCGGPGTQPYGAFRRLLSKRFGIDRQTTADDAHALITEVVSDLFPAVKRATMVRLLHQFLGFYSGYQWGPADQPPAPLEARMALAVRQFLAADAERTPLLFVLDDVHAATPETLKLLVDVTQSLSYSSLAFVLLGKAGEELPRELKVRTEAVHIPLLTELEKEQFFAQLLHLSEPAPARLRAHIREHLHSTPRTLVEFCRYLYSAGVLKPDTDTFHWKIDSDRLVHTDLPRTMEDVIRRQIDLLPTSVQKLLEMAATQGTSFWAEALVAIFRSTQLFRFPSSLESNGPSLAEIAQVADQTHEGLQQDLNIAEDSGIISREDDPSGLAAREYRFSHSDVQELLFARIPLSERTLYHQMIAQWWELRSGSQAVEVQEEIAHHWRQANNGARAALFLTRAADWSKAHFLNDKAIRLYKLAIDQLDPEDITSRMHIWHEVGSVCALKGDHEQGLLAFERVLRLSWLTALRTKAAVAFNRMGRIYLQKGDLPIALEYIERALELFRQAEDQRGIAASLDDSGQVLWLLARYAEALDRSAQGLEIRRQLRDPSAIATSLLHIAQIERHRGLLTEAEACYEEALEIRTALQDRAGLAQVYIGYGRLALDRSDLVTARDRWQEGHDLAEQIGALPIWGLLLCGLGEVDIQLGSLDVARRHLESAEVIAYDLDDRRLLSHTLRNLGTLDARTGRLDRATERCQDALKIANASGIRIDVGRAYLALGEINSYTLFDEGHGATSAAEDYYLRGIGVFREIGNQSELAHGLKQFARYRIERGDIPAGKKLLREADEIYVRLGAPSQVVKRMMSEIV